VREVLARHKASGGLLTLEITETTLMGRLDTALTAMRDLRDLGVRFAIDDFGTGYSSLAYLGTLPIDSLKIDRSFVQHLDSRPQNIEIVRAVLNLGHSLGRHVVAEGVEREEEMAVLRTLGVDVAQGYLISRPLPAEAILPLLGEPVPRTEPESAIA
jgi:EAL domain-containing protein (putative c-di-GMP-specific phosphodiesterase class I)